MAIREPGVDLSYIMLMTGFYKDNVLVDGTLEPVPNNMVILEQDSNQGTKQTLLRSSDSGKLFHFGNKKNFNYKTIKWNHRLIIPPSDTVMAAAAASKEKNWDKKYLELVKEAGIKAIELPKIANFTKSQLRKPNPPPTKKGHPDPDKSYREWFKSLGNIKFRAIPLRQTRALFFVFSDNKIFDGATITICHESQKYPDESSRINGGSVKDNENLYSTVHFDSPKNLLSGVYTIKVSLTAEFTSSDNEKWSPIFRDVGYYELKARVDFSIKTPAGDVDIIHCDPISVEETLLQQFPTEYANLIDAAKNSASDVAPKGKAIYAKSLTGLETLVTGVTLANSKLKWSAGIVTSDSHYKLFSQLGETLAAAVGDIDPTLKDTVNMAVTMNSAVGKWRELRDKLNKKIAGMITADKDWSELKNIWLAFNLKGINRSVSNTEIADLVINVYGREIDEAMGNVIQGKWARRAEIFGKAVDNLKYAELALSGYTAATSTAQIAKSYGEQKTNKSVLKETIEQYAKDTKQSDAAGEYNIPARVGLQYIESSCRATVLKELKFESELINAINTYVDLALAVCAMIPATAPLVAVYATVKTVYELGKAPVDMVVNGYYLVDRLFYHSAAADLKKLQKNQTDHHNTAIANLFLLREDMSENSSNKYLESYRLRAHALNGLYGLMTRAAMDVLTKEGIEDFTPEQKIKEYKKLCNTKYHLATYIQNFLLNDAWTYNHNSWVPINMDTWWTYASNLKNPKFDVGSEKLGYFGVDSKTLKLFRVKETEAKKEINDYGFFAGIRYLYHEVGNELPDLQKADFQRSFPIHFMSSGNFEEFAKQYENVRVELDHNSIVYSAMYYREWDEKKDSDWKLMKDKWLPNKYWFDSASAISPLTQVRVLVVLQKDLQYPYPISLQVNRIDYNDINGPVYSGFCRKLTSKDILAVDKDAQKYKDGYHGYVFYPFYQLENVTVPGIKPLANEFAMLFGLGYGVDTYYHNGHLTDMEYRLVLTLAKRDTTQQSVKINREHDHDYFTVSVDAHKEYDFKDSKGKLVSPKPRYEKAFIDYDFLKARGQQMVYSEILKNPHITCLMRLITKEGTTPYFGINQAFDPEYIALNDERFEGIEMQMEANNFFLKIKDFDWNSSVEFMFVVTCPEIAINKESESLAKSKKEKIGWKAIPFKIEMGGYRSILANHTGPILNSTLHYLGEWGYDKFTKKDYAEYEVFKPLVKQIENIHFKGTKSERDASEQYLQKRLLNRSKDAQSYINQEINDTTNQKKIYDGLKWNYFMRRYVPQAHVFAAHVKLSYESLRGKKIHGLRPFGEMPEKGEFFDFVFNSVSTAANAGINGGFVTGASINAMNFSQFRVQFSAPKDYTGKDTAPWILAEPNNESIDIPKGKVLKSEVKDWIENKSSVLLHPYIKKRT